MWGRTLHSRSQWYWLLWVAGAVFFVLAVQAQHFHNRPYRQDEAWAVHYTLDNIEDKGLVRHLAQVFSYVYPENFLQDIWVYAFGGHERVVRFFSTLITSVTLALYYRLSRDMFGTRAAGLSGVLLLGSYNIFAYYSHEARPYAALAFGAVGYTLALQRYILRPNVRRGFLLFILAVVPIYLHPFVVVVIISQLLCVLIFLRWDKALYTRGIALHSCIALSVILRMAINYSSRDGVIPYNIPPSWQGVAELYTYFRSEPESLGALLLVGGLLFFVIKLCLSPRSKLLSGLAEFPQVSALSGHMRFPRIWLEGWLVCSLLFILAIPWLVNTVIPSLTPRNLFIAAPFIVLLVQVSLRHFPLYLQIVIVFVFSVSFVTGFRFLNGNAGYWELTDYVDAHVNRSRDRVLVVATAAWEAIAINYYLQERAAPPFPPEKLLYMSSMLSGDEIYIPLSLGESSTVTGYGGQSDWERVQAFLGDSEDIWVLTGHPYVVGQKMLAALDEAYVLYQATSFPGAGYYRALEVLHYRRKPQNTEPQWRFGERFNLLDWRLLDAADIATCQPLTLETWWSVESPVDALYSSTVVLVGQDGNGVVNADNVPGGVTPTSLWQPGNVYFDKRSLSIPCDVPPGEYALLLGMYKLPDAGAPLQRLAVHTREGINTGRTYEFLSTVELS